jgi:putative membrane protein
MKITTTFAVAAFCVSSIAAQTTLSERDTKFMAAAAEGNMMEIKLAELAQTNGTSQEVKDLGMKIKTDHTKSQEELQALAAQKNVTLPTAMNEKAQKHYDSMAKKQGQDFDKTYTKCMVMDHKKDICKFKKEAKKGDDAGVKAWAANTVPVLEQHKQMSETTCKAVKKNK